MMEVFDMMNVEELKADRRMVNEIDWEMTPEKAIGMFLEWGSGWSWGNDFVSHPGQEALYFVLYDFEGNPQVTLIRRNMEGAEEIAKVEVPMDLFMLAWKEDGDHPGVGVHALNRELVEWVSETLNASPASIIH